MGSAGLDFVKLTGKAHLLSFQMSALLCSHPVGCLSKHDTDPFRGLARLYWSE